MQAFVSVITLTKAFLLNFLRILPVMKSLPSVLLGLRLVPISSATSLAEYSCCSFCFLAVFSAVVYLKPMLLIRRRRKKLLHNITTVKH
jgi:hypothetical protein